MTAFPIEEQPDPIEVERNLLLTPDEQRGLILGAVGLIDSDDFEERIVGIETQAAIEHIDALVLEPGKLARKAAKAEVRNEANRKYTREHKKKPPSREKSYQIWVGNFGRQIVSVATEHDWSLTPDLGGDYVFYGQNEVEMTMRRRLETRETVRHELTSNYNERIEDAIDSYYRAESEARSAVASLRMDLHTRMNDPDFIEASASWVNTPDSRYQAAKDDPEEQVWQHIGLNGKGFNGGIVHMLEYWGDPDKRRRFERLGVDEMSVDEFIRHTEYYKSVLDNADQLEGDSEAFIMEDTQGNRRYHILLPPRRGDAHSAGIFVVGFAHHADGIPRIASIIPIDIKHPHYFYDRVQDCLEGRDRGVLNRMEGDVHIVYATENPYDAEDD